MHAPAQHEHIPITFAFTTGPDAVRLLVIGGVLLVTAAAFVRPFVALGRAAQQAITVVAGTVLLLLLLIAGELDMPQQGVVALLAAAAVPLAVVRHRDGTTTPLTRLLRPAAPWVAGAAGTLAAVELARVLGAADPASTLRLVHTSIGVGLVGLSWLMLARPARATTANAVTDVGGWLLGNVVLAGAVAVAVLGLP